MKMHWRIRLTKSTDHATLAGQLTPDAPWIVGAELPHYVREYFLAGEDGVVRYGDESPTDWADLARLVHEDPCSTVEGTEGDTITIHTDIEETHFRHQAPPAPLPNPFSGIRCLDGAKWGVSDFYDDNREALLAALQSGDAFDTGWYGVKKEIESGRVYRPVAAPEGMVVYVEASCSDDFDTEGHGKGEVEVIPYEDAETLLDRICEALDRAMDEAQGNRKDNSGVILWSIHDATRAWVETYLQDVSGFGWDTPPGDCYSRWGFQGEKVIPKPIRQQIEDGIYRGESPFTVGEYTVKSQDLEGED